MSPEVLGAYWTTAGPVDIGTGREWSLFDWPTRCAEAARVGLRGLGIWHADLEHLLGRWTLGQLGEIFRENGLEHLELEFLNDWFVPAGDPRRAVSDRQRALLFEAADALGAHHIKVGNLRHSSAGLDQLTEAFALLCADAAERHSAPLMYELMPFDENAPSLEAVLAVVTGAGAANGGLALDTWHLGKMGIGPDQLRAIPPAALRYVELSDGLRRDLPNLSTETTRYRELPGMGEFDLPGYVRVLHELGYRGPWGVEVLSDALRALPIERMYADTARSTLAQIEKGLA